MLYNISRSRETVSQHTTPRNVTRGNLFILLNKIIINEMIHLLNAIYILSNPFNHILNNSKITRKHRLYVYRMRTVLNVSI